MRFILKPFQFIFSEITEPRKNPKACEKHSYTKKTSQQQESINLVSTGDAFSPKVHIFSISSLSSVLPNLVTAKVTLRLTAAAESATSLLLVVVQTPENLLTVAGGRGRFVWLSPSLVERERVV